MNKQLKEVMTKEPVTVGPNVLATDALEIMRAWGLRHLPVTENQQTIGLLSDRDIYKHLALLPRQNLTVKDAMTSSPYVAQGFEMLSKIARTMADNKYGCTIVENAEGQICGIFTTIDALYILSNLLKESGESEFHTMNIEDYLRVHQPRVAV